MAIVHKWSQPVTFGDCDPAGIVFYPNFFAWFDRTFHDWLRNYGGHAAICNSLGALGLGLMEVNAKFQAPLRDGDTLEIQLDVAAWDRKALHLSYECRTGGRTAVIGQEIRGLFKTVPMGIMAAEMQEFRTYLENYGRPSEQT